MHTNRYLFGEDRVDEIPEFDSLVLVRRIELLNEHLSELLQVNYRDRDEHKIRDVLKAITWHEDMKRR